MRVIGITGKARSGKDTIAEILREKGYERTALADPLRDIVKGVFHPSEEEQENREQELENWPGWSVRKLLQFIGTELFRKNIAEDVWVRSLLLRTRDSEKKFVVSDIRFPNEAEALRSAFGDDFTLIRVERPGADGEVGIRGHESEAYTLEGDVLIQNGGTLDDLRNAVLSLTGEGHGEEKDD